MIAKVILFSYKHGVINNFLNKFYNSNIKTENSLFWKKDFPNPVDISEIIATFSDNNYYFDIDMWVSFDKDVFVKISPKNTDLVIKYIFERYPY